MFIPDGSMRSCLRYSFALDQFITLCTECLCSQCTPEVVIKDFSSDLKSGRMLLLLIEVLTGKKQVRYSSYKTVSCCCVTDYFCEL